MHLHNVRFFILTIPKTVLILFDIFGLWIIYYKIIINNYNII